MSGSDFAQGLKRVSSMETDNAKMGRGKDAGVPKTRLRGDGNPLKSGGINRATQGYKTRKA